MKIEISGGLLLAWMLNLSLFSALAAGEETITQNELVRRTQELFDAVIPADQAPWKKYYADDCMYNDEKGRSFDKSKLVADIAPLPKGYSGSIKIKNPQSRITADTAVLLMTWMKPKPFSARNCTRVITRRIPG